MLFLLRREMWNEKKCGNNIPQRFVQAYLIRVLEL